jgi:hypothetical protein
MKFPLLDGYAALVRSLSPIFRSHLQASDEPSRNVDNQLPANAAYLHNHSKASITDLVCHTMIELLSVIRSGGKICACVTIFRSGLHILSSNVFLRGRASDLFHTYTRYVNQILLMFFHPYLATDKSCAFETFLK